MTGHSSKDGKTIYAMTLGSPNNGVPILLKSFADLPRQVTDVKRLSEGKVKWAMKNDRLEISIGPQSKDTIALAFKIILSQN